jgi:hypothetical protein
MRNLPVVPICRGQLACPVGQISGFNSPVSRSQEGRIAIVTDVGRGMRWTLRTAQDERGHDRLASELIRQPNRRVGSGGVGYRPNFEFQ